MPSVRLPEFPPIRDIVRFGQEPGDDERTRSLKAMATIVVLATTVLSISMLPEPGRSPFLRLLDLVVISIELQALWRFWRGRTVENLFRALVPGYFAFMVFSVTINGTSEGDPFALMIIPSAAVVILGPRRSLVWLGLSLVAQLGLALIEPILPYWQTKLATMPLNPEGLMFHSPAKKPLSRTEAETLAAGTALLYFMFRSAHLQLTRARDEVAAEQARGDRLMASIYPPAVLDELKQAGSDRIVEEVAEASVLFADLEGFTRFSDRKSPAELVDFLERLFAEFDRLAERHGAEKIKTMGDGYLAAAGLRGTGEDHAAALCALGHDMVATVARLTAAEGADLGLRVGVHSGPVVAGVLGRKRPHYDIWGGTVNMAHRLQANAPRGTVQITGATRALLGDRLSLTPQGTIEMKGLGAVPCWLAAPAA